VETLFPRARRDPGRKLLELDGVGGHGLEDVSLEVCAGEVVGLAGLVGSGKAEIGRMCFGLARPSAGRIAIAGEDVARRASPRARLERGVVYYPADRREEGIVPMRSIRENVALQARGERDLARRGVLRRAAERTRAAEVVERLRIHPAQPEARVASLSGGNQQKVVLARALMTDATVHIFDEPTAGVDVGARVEVYDFIRELCEGGSAVLLISSDLPEVVHLAHRVYVVHAGRIRAHLEGDRITEESVLGNFFDGGSQP
jgi:ribose transport system ATP-binding protein